MSFENGNSSNYRFSYDTYPSSAGPTVEVMRLNSNATLPTKAHGGDAGIDLYASEDVFIRTGETVVVPTGIAMNVPNGFYGKIEDRSSLASVGLRTGAGVVDAGYLGELGVVIHNLNNQSESSYRGKGYQIKRGQRVAQIVIQQVTPVLLREVESLENTERGSRGFGSSGR